jgi:hypothetical protein
MLTVFFGLSNGLLACSGREKTPNLSSPWWRLISQPKCQIQIFQLLGLFALAALPWATQVPNALGKFVARSAQILGIHKSSARHVSNRSGFGNRKEQISRKSPQNLCLLPTFNRIMVVHVQVMPPLLLWKNVLDLLQQKLFVPTS